MKISKRMLSVLMIAGVISGNVPIYATQIGTKPLTVPKTIPVTTPAPTSTPSQISYITFDKGEYVRVTQPTKSDSLVFNSQLNVMGEARVGTNIIIKLYVTDKDGKDPYPTLPYKVYEVPEVGASRTFNQLIDLKVGKNKIVISYNHKDDKVTDIAGAYYIVREPEEVKEDMKNSIVDLKQPFLAAPAAAPLADKVGMEKR